MSSIKGNQPTDRLNDLLHGVIDYTDHAPQSDEDPLTPPPNGPTQQKDDEMSEQQKRPRFSGAAITTLVSLIALLFSGYSFYETVLKQPTIKLYAPPLIHLYRKEFRDIFAYPVTLSNDGAKRGTVLSFDLTVSNPKTGKRKTFRNLYFGNDPKDTSRIFTPLTIAGRSSVTDVILFRANETGAFFETTGGVPLELELELSLNIDEAEFWIPPKTKQSLKFNVHTNFIQSFSKMEDGKPTVLYRRDAETP